MALTDVGVSKLDQKQQEALLVWLCEGLGPTEISQLVKDTFGIELSKQGVDYYRVKHKDLIDEVEAQALEAAARTGWGKRTYRQASIARKLEKLDRALDDGQPKDFAVIGSAYKDMLGEYRKEAGETETTKVAVKVEGKVEQDVRVSIGTIGEQAPDVAAILEEVGGFDPGEDGASEEAGDAEADEVDSGDTDT